MSSPAFLKWSAEEVSEWIASLGYPQYRVIVKCNLLERYIKRYCILGLFRVQSRKWQKINLDRGV